MARVDLNHENGWIQEQSGGAVLNAVARTSAVESVAKRVQLRSDELTLSGVQGADPRIVEEGADIPEAALVFDSEIASVVKYAEILKVSYEDIMDQNGNILDTYKADWFTKFAQKYDNAALGTVGAKGTTVATRAARPFNSVYQEATEAGAVLQTAGSVTLDDLSQALSDAEDTEYFNAGRGVIIAHPSFKGALRMLKDAAGNPVFSAGQALAGGVGSEAFGYEIVFSTGARTSEAQSANPTGNPLFIITDRDNLLNGVRSGPESILSTEVDFKSDQYNLKVRARRAFMVAHPESLSVVELTA